MQQHGNQAVRWVRTGERTPYAISPWPCHCDSFTVTTAWFTFCLQRARAQRSRLGRDGFKANHWHALNRLIWVVVPDAARTADYSRVDHSRAFIPVALDHTRVRAENVMHCPPDSCMQIACVWIVCLPQSMQPMQLHILATHTHPNTRTHAHPMSLWTAARTRTPFR